MANTSDPMYPVNTISECANHVNGRMFDDATVSTLARIFKGTIFTVTISTDAIGGREDSLYWVGVREAKRIEINSQRVLLSFNNTQPKPIISAFVVPMMPSDQMFRRAGSSSIEFPRETPALSERIKNTWKLLDLTAHLTNPTAVPRIVLTSALTGCTFAIGRIGHHVYMGHVQAKGTTGIEVTKALTQGPIFDGLPAPLESKFFIHPGGESNTASGLGYGEMTAANVLGLVLSGKLSFIVAIVSRAGTRQVEKVMLVTQTSPTSPWSSRQI